MGLDVIAYAAVEPGAPDTRYRAGECGVRLDPRDVGSWRRHSEGLVPGVLYGYSAMKVRHVGSYGRYNAFRERLAVVVSGVSPEDVKAGRGVPPGALPTTPMPSCWQCCMAVCCCCWRGHKCALSLSPVRVGYPESFSCSACACVACERDIDRHSVPRVPSPLFV